MRVVIVIVYRVRVCSRVGARIFRSSTRAVTTQTGRTPFELCGTHQLIITILLLFFYYLYGTRSKLMQCFFHDVCSVLLLGLWVRSILHEIFILKQKKKKKIYLFQLYKPWKYNKHRSTQKQLSGCLCLQFFQTKLTIGDISKNMKCLRWKDA